jgi:hypothetical protein
VIVPHDMRAPDGAIHAFFGLTYADYLVVPRTVLQSMPLNWQEHFVALLRQVEETFPDLPTPAYDVRVLARGPELIFVDPPCSECDGEGIGDGEEECSACRGSGVDENVAGDELRYETPEEVGIVPDPIPGYNRGRTRLLPAPSKGSGDQ